MLFKRFFYLEFWEPLCSVEQNHLWNFGRGIMGNIHLKLFKILTSGSGGDVV